MHTNKSRILGITALVTVVALMFAGPSLAQYENRGDINLNGTPFELEDVALFADYFVLGLSVFTIDYEAQIAATDVNMDGLTLSVADFVYMLRVIWGEGDPPIPPTDTIAVSFGQYNFESSLRLHVSLDASYDGDQMLLHYNTNGTTSFDVVVYPGYDEIYTQYEHTGHNLILSVSGLHSVLNGVNFMKINYTGEMPLLEQIGGSGFNGEALDFTVYPVVEYQRGDVNMNGVAFEIADAVLLTNGLIYGEVVLRWDLEVQLTASDVNLDGIPLTVEDQEFLIAVILGRIDPDAPLGPTFQEQFIVSQNNESISITSTAENEVGAISLEYLAPNLTDYQVTLSEDVANMMLSYDMVGDTLRIVIYSFSNNDYIATSATDVVTITYTGDQPSLLSASSAGYNAEKVNLSIINRGDVNGDGEINVADVVAIIRIVFGWDAPEAWQLVALDTNCDGLLDIGEAVYLINYIFRDGPPPTCP